MKLSLLRQSLVVLASGMSVASAQASTIDFNEIATADCLGGASASITSDGFVFTGSGPLNAMTICNDSSGSASNGSNFLSEIWNFTIIMTAVDDSTFSLNSLDASRLHQAFALDPTELRITGMLSGAGASARRLLSTTWQMASAVPRISRTSSSRARSLISPA